MVIMILERVPASLRGELSRWLMELKAGVYLGHVSALVREALWKRCTEKLKDGGCMLIYSWPTEQGFKIECFGRLSRDVVNNDGLYLMRKPYMEVELEPLPGREPQGTFEETEGCRNCSDEPPVESE